MPYGKTIGFVLFIFGVLLFGDAFISDIDGHALQNTHIESVAGIIVGAFGLILGIMSIFSPSKKK